MKHANRRPCAWVLALGGIPLGLLPSAHYALAATGRIGGSVSFDADWRFLKADAPGAEQPAFDDSAWRKLDVPHDWSIEGPFTMTASAPGLAAGSVAIETTPPAK